MKKLVLLSCISLNVGFLNAQNVGIGTTNPFYKLEVRGSSTDDGAVVTIGNSDNSHRLLLFGGRQNDPMPFIGWKKTDPLRFATDSSGFTEFMRIDKNGMVGIGTTLPAEKLTVYGNAMYTGPGSRVFINKDESSEVASLIFNQGGAGLGKSWAEIGLSGDYKLHFKSNPSEGQFVDRMVIDNITGNVGIGTSSPNASAQLDVNTTTKGFLPPRMTSEQRNSIASPASGLVIYNLSTNCLNFYTGNRWNEICGTPSASYPAGSVFCASGATNVVDVLNPTTGKTWMDRNLGASRGATSISDTDSYGDLYQWGRKSDGHQCRTSPTTNVLSSTDVPAGNNFILNSSIPLDWRSPQNTNLWQGVNGVNNPCPIGYRVPTSAELNAERLSWSSQNSAGAFGSPLKLPMAGVRSNNFGAIFDSGGTYWGSTVSEGYSGSLGYNSSVAEMNSSSRATGRSLRCIKD